MDDRTADQPPIRPEQRRSSRFSVVVPVEVKWQEPSGKIVKQAAQAKEVNAQGGLLEMKIYPWVGGDLDVTTRAREKKLIDELCEVLRIPGIESKGLVAAAEDRAKSLLKLL